MAGEVEARQIAEGSVLRVVPGILSALTRKIKITELLAGSGKIGDVDIDKIVFGTVHIDTLTLQGTSANIKSGHAYLKNIRVIVSVDIEFDWSVDMGLLGHPGGSTNIGPFNFPFTVGDLDVPSLQDIPLSIPNASTTNLTANVPPLSNLDLGGGVFTRLEATGTDLPSDGFQVTGLGFGGVTLSSLQVPSAETQKATIQEFKPNGEIKIPLVALSDISLPAVNAPDIKTTDAFDFIADPSQQVAKVGVGPISAGFKVTPSVHVFVDSFELTNVAISAGVGQAKVENVGVPVDIRGINLKNIEISQLNINGVSL
jgi:hypothetical protein